jgi:hypothetical protein
MCLHSSAAQKAMQKHSGFHATTATRNHLATFPVIFLFVSCDPLKTYKIASRLTQDPEDRVFQNAGKVFSHARMLTKNEPLTALTREVLGNRHFGTLISTILS